VTDWTSLCIYGWSCESSLDLLLLKKKICLLPELHCKCLDMNALCWLFSIQLPKL
jgi:hypothetical protein